MKPVPLHRHRVVHMSAHVWWWERESLKERAPVHLRADDIHRLSLSMMAAKAFDKIKGKT